VLAVAISGCMDRCETMPLPSEVARGPPCAHVHPLAAAKARLAVNLNELIDRRGLSQTEAAEITGMTHPKVSLVRRYKLRNISLERLMQAPVAIDQCVEIVVRPAGRAKAAGISVAA
jgi:predicted XRE-type DNA-binding protein